VTHLGTSDAVFSRSAVPTPHWAWALVASGLILVTVMTFRPVLEAQFISWDDPEYLGFDWGRNGEPVERPDCLLKDVAGLRSIWNPFNPALRASEALRRYLAGDVANLFAMSLDQYYPLVFTSFWLEHHAWGLDPRGYHTTNLVLHVLNVVLVLWLLRTLGASIGVAAAAAAVFALHPAQVSSVAWITERKNLLSGFFYLVAFLMYLWHRRSGGARRWIAYAACVAAFVAALLSKTQTLTFPFALAAADVVLQRRGRLPRLGGVGLTSRLLPMLVLALAAAQLTARVEFAHTLGAVLPSTPIELRLFIAARALWSYVATFAAPLRLAPIYPHWEVAPFAASPAALVWWGALLASVAAAIVLFRIRRRIDGLTWWGLAQSFLAVLPILGLVSFNYQKYSYVADHYLYLACIGGGVAMAQTAARWTTRGGAARRAQTIAAVTLLAACSALSYREASHWKSVESFWTHAIERNPNSLTAYYNLGNHFYTMRQLDRALPLYERASQMDSDNGRALNAYLWTLDFLRGTDAVRDACRARLQQAEDAERAGRQREALRIYQQLNVGAPKYVKECDAAEAIQRLGETH